MGEVLRANKRQIVGVLRLLAILVFLGSFIGGGVQSPARAQAPDQLHATIYNRLVPIIVDKLGVEPDKVTPGARFVEDFGADSLDMVELIMAYEFAYGISIPDEDAAQIKTVDDAVKVISRYPHK